MDTSLIAENVFYAAGNKDILSGATLRADKGKITGLLGRNGAGKSSLMECVFGIKKATECDVFINGIKIKHPYTIDGRSQLPSTKTIFTYSFSHQGFDKSLWCSYRYITWLFP